MAKSYVDKAGLDTVDTIYDAMIEAHLTVAQCIDLCDATERTWYRWMKTGAPRWAIRLVMSQRGSLDYLGWKNWEIDGGCLYFKQLSYRYYWTPPKLIMPLYNARSSDLPWKNIADNLSSLEVAREARQIEITPKIQPLRQSG